MFLLAKDWNKSDKPDGWWMSEKFDGLRIYWDGESKLYSRLGKQIKAPEFWTSSLPKIPLDGELWYK